MPRDLTDHYDPNKKRPHESTISALALQLWDSRPRSRHAIQHTEACTAQFAYDARSDHRFACKASQCLAGFSGFGPITIYLGIGLSCAHRFPTCNLPVEFDASSVPKQLVGLGIVDQDELVMTKTLDVAHT